MVRPFILLSIVTLISYCSQGFKFGKLNCIRIEMANRRASNLYFRAQTQSKKRRVKMKRFKMEWVLVLAIAIGLLAGGGTTAMAADKIILKVAHNGNAEHPFSDAYMKFKEVIESETGGAVEVQIFPAEQLGTDEQVTQSIKLGTVAGNMSGSAALAEFYSEAELFNLPFVFRRCPWMGVFRKPERLERQKTGHDT
jgi:hypothetical protein